MKRIVLLVCVLAACLAPRLAHSQDQEDGNELSLLCAPVLKVEADPSTVTQGEAFRGAACLSLVRGVGETMSYWQGHDADMRDAPGHACIPDGVTPVQAAKVVIKFLNNHPSRLHERDVILILNALQDSFPCSKK